jgi:tetratricopeptide (TPR) repeat protein
MRAKAQPHPSTEQDRQPFGDIEHSRLPGLLRDYFASRNHLRKGICLLNAGAYEQAVTELSAATKLNPDNKKLPAYLVAALVGRSDLTQAAAITAQYLDQSPNDVDAIIRLALVRFKTGKHDEAVRTLRNGVRNYTDNAELHFQLGTMLSALDQIEEAELRFTQALSIQKDHADALVSQAMCRGVAGDMTGALRSLEKAQKARPSDAGIALLLTHAAKAKSTDSKSAGVWAEMPAEDDTQSNAADLDVLSKAIENDPEFAEAFFEIDDDDVNEPVYQMLVAVLMQAVQRSPQRARLHYLCGAALARLNRSDDAIAAVEQALSINPRYVKALILLAKLYECSERPLDAASRLEQTILLGAEYADTYYLLGNLYCDTGQIERARWAYKQALRINSDYEAAKKALDTLAA